MTANEKAKTTESENRASRKTLEGVVISDRMDKTRSVRLVRRFRHPLYEKVMTRSSKVYAHDEKNESHTGDRVALEETRPLSKLKRWRVVGILEKARVSASVATASEIGT